jgi:hypothetical protein
MLFDRRLSGIVHNNNTSEYLAMILLLLVTFANHKVIVV